MDKILKYWKIITFTLPIVGTITWTLITLYFDVQGLKEDKKEDKEMISRLQNETISNKIDISNLKVELQFEKMYNDPK